MSVNDQPRDSNGNFRKQVKNGDIISLLSKSTHALQTTVIAGGVGLSRTSAYERLRALEEDGVATSWLVTETVRVWTIPGSWGEVSVLEYCDEDIVEYYLSTGAFPWDVSADKAAEAIERALEDFAWYSKPDELPKYDEWRQIADLVDGVSAEEMSPSTIRECAISGSFGPLPRFRGEDFRNHRQQHGVALSELSKKTGIKIRYISEWERGRRDLETDEKASLTHSLQALTPPPA
jgi:DNA-binding transcriptional regulator YiaG